MPDTDPSAISPKVKATAAAGAVVSAATLVAALFGVDITLDDEAAGLVGLALTAAVAFAGYLRRDPARIGSGAQVPGRR